MINREDFLLNGFLELTDDPFFKWIKYLVDDEEIEKNELKYDDVPSLLYGDSGLNRGFCIYTGENFIWIRVADVKGAIEFSEKIIAFEPL